MKIEEFKGEIIGNQHMKRDCSFLESSSPSCMCFDLTHNRQFLRTGNDYAFMIRLLYVFTRYYISYIFDLSMAFAKDINFFAVARMRW